MGAFQRLLQLGQPSARVHGGPGDAAGTAFGRAGRAEALEGPCVASSVAEHGAREGSPQPPQPLLFFHLKELLCRYARGFFMGPEGKWSIHPEGLSISRAHSACDFEIRALRHVAMWHGARSAIGAVSPVQTIRHASRNFFFSS